MPISKWLPAPLTSGYLCSHCHGTGADPDRTFAARRTGDCDDRSYIRCWNCNGNGLDPAAYFRYSDGVMPAAKIIGARVLNVHRQEGSHKGAHGTITIAEGCLVKVRFDDRDYDAWMVPSDLAYVDLWPREGCRVSLPF